MASTRSIGSVLDVSISSPRVAIEGPRERAISSGEATMGWDPRVTQTPDLCLVGLSSHPREGSHDHDLVVGVHRRRANAGVVVPDTRLCAGVIVFSIVVTAVSLSDPYLPGADRQGAA